MLATELKEQLQAFCHQYPGPYSVALSGGVDSVVLTHALNRLGAKLLLLHVHHGLAAYNDDMMTFCQQWANSMHLPLLCLKAPDLHQIPGNIEQNARQARYQLLQQHQQGHLLLAQHGDDLCESRLIAWAQGRIERIHTAMPQGPQRLRPFLGLTRAHILAYAKTHQLIWFDDPSNQEMHLLRNQLRQQLRQQEFHPKVLAQLKHYSELAARLQVYTDANNQNSFSLDDVLSDSGTWRFASWLRQQTGYSLGKKRSQALLQLFCQAAQDKQPAYVLGHACIRRYQGKLYCTHQHCQFQGKVLNLPDNWRLQIGIPSGKNWKKRMQRWQVPAWMRPCLPTFWQAERLMAIWGCWHEKNSPSFALYWQNMPDWLENYPLPLSKNCHFQYTVHTNDNG